MLSLFGLSDGIRQTKHLLTTVESGSRYHVLVTSSLAVFDAVLNLCEVLRHDVDACPSLAEQRDVSDAGHSLQQRWKTICSLVTQRRIT